MADLYLRTRYNSFAIFLHWSIAALIAANFTVGFWMENLGEPCRTFVVRFHESSGMTILLLSIVRLGWRLLSSQPPLNDNLSKTEKRLAKTVHVSLYVAMIMMPVLGWAIISANPPRYEQVKIAKDSTSDIVPRRKYILLWGAIPLPPIKSIENVASEPDGLTRQHHLHSRFVQLHMQLGFAMLTLLAFHVAGALKHQFIDRDFALGRMGLGRHRSNDGARIGSRSES